MKSKVRTAVALGLMNVIQVLIYRTTLKLRTSAVVGVKSEVPKGPFFRAFDKHNKSSLPQVPTFRPDLFLFGHINLGILDRPPDWLANPLTGRRINKAEKNWWQIPDFDPVVGDIKLIWELSRFDWLLALSQAACRGDGKSLQRLNVWLEDWCLKNPPYLGPNWKCGQEASIRVMHLATAALLLGQERTPEIGLINVVRVHLKRIAPTIRYAKAQNNNHGTSEAAALFIGGTWLVRLGFVEGQRWADLGRNMLEDCSSRLIGDQGSFSQYSLNYHRMMLDTLSLTEIWRREFELPPFSSVWESRAKAATEWLLHMINAVSGDAPSIGANDGARLINVTRSAFRDYRPSVQLASALFLRKRAYACQGPWDDGLKWFNVSEPRALASLKKAYVADDGGFVILRKGVAMVVVRYPRFRFRPSQCDALHLDLWLGEENVFRGSGTYTYNDGTNTTNMFNSSSNHNTIQFDDREQMEPLSRFLYCDWLKTEIFEYVQENDNAMTFGVGYQNSKGAGHFRRVRLGPGSLLVNDEVRNFSQKAVLRWRLQAQRWILKNDARNITVLNRKDKSRVLSINCDKKIVRSEILDGWESRHYLKKTKVAVLEVEVHEPCLLVTELIWGKN